MVQEQPVSDLAVKLRSGQTRMATGPRILQHQVHEAFELLTLTLLGLPGSDDSQ